jgi:hypothetical protein
MLRKFAIISILSFLSAGTPVAGAEKRHSDVSVTLDVAPTKTLVGIAPSLRLTVTNDGAGKENVPKYMIMRVTPQRGDSFVAMFGSKEGEQFAAPLPIEQAVLAPKATSIVDFPATDITTRAPWFYDPRWLMSGTYRIQVLLVDNLNVVGSPAVADLESILPVRAASREVVFVVEEPSGDDAVVWNALKQGLEPRGPEYAFSWRVPNLERIATEYVQKYPSSAYSLHLGRWVSGNPKDTRVAVLQRLIEANPGSEILDQLWREVANDAVILSTEAVIRNDTSSATRWNEVARQHLSRLSESKQPQVSAWSKKKLAELPTATDLREQIAEQQQPSSD